MKLLIKSKYLFRSSAKIFDEYIAENVFTYCIINYVTNLNI